MYNVVLIGTCYQSEVWKNRQRLIRCVLSRLCVYGVVSADIWVYVRECVSMCLRVDFCGVVTCVSLCMGVRKIKRRDEFFFLSARFLALISSTMYCSCLLFFLQRTDPFYFAFPFLATHLNLTLINKVSYLFLFSFFAKSSVCRAMLWSEHLTRELCELLPHNQAMFLSPAIAIRLLGRAKINWKVSAELVLNRNIIMSGAEKF